MDDQRWRANDDGEPAHSAGDPILGQIRSSELTNVLVVVVRYFGGTKLGVGGLIYAYKTATEDALSKAGTISIFETKDIHLSFPYDILSEVERLMGEFEIDVTKRDFQLSCEIDGTIRKERLEDFQDKIVDLYTLKVEVN